MNNREAEFMNGVDALSDRPAWDKDEPTPEVGKGSDTGVIAPLNAADAPKADAVNRIVFNFPNDHDIGGLKVEIVGVTPEQIAVAVFYLERSANQLADMRQMQASLNARELAAAQAAVAKERGLITDHRGRRGRN